MQYEFLGDKLIHWCNARSEKPKTLSVSGQNRGPRSKFKYQRPFKEISQETVMSQSCGSRSGSKTQFHLIVASKIKNVTGGEKNRRCILNMMMFGVSMSSW